MNKFNNITLKDWQNTNKPINEIIIGCSNPDKSDRSEKYNFPIGFHVGYLKNLSDKQKESIQIGEHKDLLLCAFTEVNDLNRRRHKKINRPNILINLKKNGFNNIHLKHNIYFNTLANYKFVISPEGNGVDCHRHYEALLCGCIPIIEDNIDMRRKYSGMPVLYTKDYSEINNNYLEKIYNKFINKKFK